MFNLLARQLFNPQNGTDKAESVLTGRGAMPKFWISVWSPHLAKNYPREDRERGKP